MSPTGDTPAPGARAPEAAGGASVGERRGSPPADRRGRPPRRADDPGAVVVDREALREAVDARPLDGPTRRRRLAAVDLHKAYKKRRILEGV